MSSEFMIHKGKTYLGRVEWHSKGRWDCCGHTGQVRAQRRKGGARWRPSWWSRGWGMPLEIKRRSVWINGSVHFPSSIESELSILYSITRETSFVQGPKVGLKICLLQLPIRVLWPAIKFSKKSSWSDAAHHFLDKMEKLFSFFSTWWNMLLPNCVCSALPQYWPCKIIGGCIHIIIDRWKGSPSTLLA